MNARSLGVASLLVVCMAIVFQLTASSSFADSLADCAVVPKPMSITPATGEFVITQATVIVVPDRTGELFRLARYFSELVNDFAGFGLEVRTEGAEPRDNTIVLTQRGADASLGDEGYTVTITAKNITIAGTKPQGVFYGIQTLRQILMSSTLDNAAAMHIAAGVIKDKPAYSWRGFQLDCSRHFMSLDYVRTCIDNIALHRMNVFHWHLTDDQGWRLEIKRYPKLTETGAWRAEGEDRHGGYYTQDEVRDIIEYARERYIMVVPEIEMPGHATAAVAAYPELSCDGKQIAVQTTWGIHNNLFCAGRESTFEFVENVLKEVSELFPSPYIHIGGDEAPKDKWKTCPECQKRIKAENLKDENELQGYFTRRVDKYVQTLGKTIIGWDEILEGGASQTAIIQSWRGMEGALEGARHGHKVISSAAPFVYLDFPNVDEGLHDTGWLKETTIQKLYSFNPTPDELTAQQKTLIIGAEAPIWTERTPEPEVDNNIFPRLSAFSEIVWIPAEKRTWDDFAGRLDTHLKRLAMAGIDYYKPSTSVGTFDSGKLATDFKELEWDVTNYVKTGHMRFTIRHDQGNNNVAIQWAALLENGREIARDTHEGITGRRDRAHNYRFHLFNKKDNATYTLKVSMKGDGGTDARGSIMVRAFDK